MSYVIAAYAVTALWLVLYAFQLSRERTALRRGESDGSPPG